ncbi:MAG TPA: VanZ family protein [Burkholderiales bacterium]|nr:VanZ family protein [Burkholderiales bacterium]
MLLVVYASLYPLSGWRNVGISPFAYLFEPWPRYVTAFDIVANVAGYLPFGFLATAFLHPRLRGVAAFAAAIVGATALSLVLEAGQSYLPARVPTTLDVVCNVGGAALGATLGQHFTFLTGGGPLSRWRAAFVPGAGADFGLMLIGLWLFIQLNPTTLLFGAGDLRDLLAPFEGRERRPEFFISIEAFTTAANLVAVALILAALAPPERPVRGLVLGTTLAALTVKTAAVAILLRAQNVFTWLTQGAQLGLFIGVAAALAAIALPRTARLVLAAVLLMAATVLVNLAPPNPYLALSLKVWHQGHFLNFNGLTRLVSAAWPFIALGYLIYLASRRREALG